MVAPARAASTAAERLRKCVASSSASAKDALTINVAPGGGNGALQSLMGAQVAIPSRSRVPPPIGHAAGAMTASHPQPAASGANPGAQAVTPTGTHAVEPMAALVPAAHASLGSTGAQPASPS